LERSLLVIPVLKPSVEFPTSQLNADVLGCNRMDQTEEVYVVDTWNPRNLPRWNVLDANQVRTGMRLIHPLVSLPNPPLGREGAL